jgi:PAS domain S-box-containing protein
MEFYNEKFKQLRKQFGLSMKHVAKRAEITHTTLWEWEKGKRTPSETRIRMLAHVLNIPVNDISSLDPEPPISSGNFSQMVQSWIDLAGSDIKSRVELKNDLTGKINHIFNELGQASVVINALMSTLHSAFYVKDVNLNYITANEAFLKIISLGSNYNVLGKSDSDFFPRNDAKINTKQDAEVLHTGKALIKHEGYIPGTRKRNWGIISKVPIYDPSGKISGIVGTFLDITERRKNEIIRELLNNSLDMLLDGFALIDSTTQKFIYINREYEKIAGTSSKEIYEDSNFLYNNCIHPDDKAKETEYFEKNNWPIIRQFRIIRPNGEVRWLEATRYIPSTAYSRYFATIIKDITERILTDAHKKRLGNCINQVATIIWSGEYVNDEFRFLHINNATLEIFGVPSDEFVKNKQIWKSLVFPEEENIGKVFITEKTKPKEFELKIVRADGQIRWLHNKIMNDENIFMGTSRDITSLIETN